MAPRLHRDRLDHVCAGTGLTPAASPPGLGPSPPHLHRDWAHPRRISTGTGLTPAASPPGLGPPPPHLHRDWAHPRRISTGTGLTPAASPPELGPPPPHLRSDWAHPRPLLHHDRAHPRPHLRRNCAGDFPPDTLEKAYAKVKSRAAMPRRLRTARRIRVATVSVLQPIYMARLRIGYRYSSQRPAQEGVCGRDPKVLGGALLGEGLGAGGR